MIIIKLITRGMSGRAILCLCLAVLFATASACLWTPARPAQAWIPIPILSSNANLSDLWLSTGSLSPAFAPGTTSYTHNDNNPSTQVKPFAEESHATITVNGSPVTSGQWSPVIPINPGPNTVTVLVTAQDGTTTKTYTITVTGPAASSDANLSDLWLSTGSLSPAFALGTTSYTHNDNNPSTQVKPFAEESHATITVNGSPVTSGQWSPVIPINPGPNTVTVLVTAQDGTTTKTYTITVTGPAASSDANLSDLITNSGQLTPAFAPGTASYTQAYTGPNLLVKPTTEESHATITVNGTAVVSGQWSQAITLNPGPNTITVKVTAQDGTTTKTYTINVTMPGIQLSSDANLSSLELTTGSISPAFAPGTTSYTHSVDNATTSTKVRPTAEESHATITVNGTVMTSGNWSGNIPLNVGDNTITVKVTAQDGTTTKTYIITVSKAATTPPSAPAAPTGLTAVASGTRTALSWTDNANNEDGFRIERKIAGGSYAQVATVGANVNSATDPGLLPGTTYYYRVYAYNTGGNSDYSNESSITLPALPPAAGQTVLRFTIGSTDYFVGNQVQSMDTAPIISEGRTLLPIRYVATPLGASVDWNQDDQKVTVTLNGKTIELWIGQNTAKVNGIAVPIDPNNPNVTPIVVPPGRTMLPLRFIAENLGCQVDWNNSTQEVTVTYPKP